MNQIGLISEGDDDSDDEKEEEKKLAIESKSQTYEFKKSY